jgi:hypothetical protein
MFMQKIIHRLLWLKDLSIYSAFSKHNRLLFSGSRNHNESQPIMLMELNAMHSSHIGYAYLADVMAKLDSAQIKAFEQHTRKSFWRRLIFCFESALGWPPFGVYKSFGVNEFISASPSLNQRKRARNLFLSLLPRLKTKCDVEDVHVNGVWIGDLIYDSYLMAFKKPTIDLSTREFKKFLLESLELFVFWEDYFRHNKVCGINVSHCVYNLAIPLRLAVHNGIPAFQTNVTHVYRLSKDNLFAYNDFFYFREKFSELPNEVRDAGIALAERRIKRRFSGEVGVDMSYSTKSAYIDPKHSRLLRISNKKKILIAAHCFFDSPHSYGKNIFPDFYEWLDFLGKLTECTDYDWYIKTHSDYLPGTKAVIDSFVARYPKFNLLPSDASHHQIIAEGIDLALTTYGTIAFEYAAMGIPVINASQNNPHIAYNFNLHAKDPEHYSSMLLDIDNLDLSIDKRQVYEYYFMRYIYNTENIFFDDYEQAIIEIGGYYSQLTPLIYKQWLSEWSSRKHSEISKGLQDFVASGRFRMDYNFYGDKFSAIALRSEQ